ncbi:MAG: hypothetical protein WC878_03440 [Candidatus Paceibacterota bacterium]
MFVTETVVNKHRTAVIEAQEKMKTLQRTYAKTLSLSVTEEWKAEFASLLSHAEILIHVGEMSPEALYEILESGYVPVKWHYMARPIVSGLGLKGAPRTVFS